VGDSTYDVLMKCGEPWWKDNSEVEVIKKVAVNEWEKTILDKGIWFYNFGPNRFMKLLFFENDKLNEIKNLGYGCLEKDIGKYKNNKVKLYMEMPKTEVLIHWGDPDYTTQTVEERLFKVNEGQKIKCTVTVSKWIYNFGSRRFIKTLTFENGRLIKIDSGGYGYDK
jgi:hypothetical protein